MDCDRGCAYYCIVSRLGLNMPNLVIVALPSEDDYVNKISSEKVAHMTLLFLGEVNKVSNLNKILDFVEFSSNLMLNRFYMEVDRRGVLGPDSADVLFFRKSKWTDFYSVDSFRSALLKDNNIRTAYDSVEQFDEWIPHLTLGYPTDPAKPDNRDYPGIYFVNFDRIAVWTEDFTGIEFPLNSHDDQEAMSDIGQSIVDTIVHISETPSNSLVQSAIDDILARHGSNTLNPFDVRR